MINSQMYAYGAEPSAIRSLFMYGLERKLEIGEENVFDFSLGNPCVPAPEVVCDTLTKLLEGDPVTLHSYTLAGGAMEVRRKIANYIHEKFDIPALARHVFVTAGAAGALAAGIFAVTNPGDEVVVIAPFFAEYRVWIESCGCKLVKAMADPETFQLDVSAVEDAITDCTAAVIINSPNNPTGAVYSAEEIEALAEVLRKKSREYKHDIFLISDEPYRKIVYDAEVPYVPAFYENTLVCDSASKSLSLPGERIGYVFVSSTAPKADKVLLAVAGAARAQGHVCATSLFQRMFAECIDEPADISLYEKNRALLTEIMDEVGLEYVEPKGAFYLWVKSPLGDAQAFSDLAKKHELLIVPSESFGVSGWVRLGYCVSTETIVNSRPAFKALMSEVR